MLRLYADGDANVARRVAENPGAVWLSSVAAEEAITGALNLMNKSRGKNNSLSLADAHEFFADTLGDIGLLSLFVYRDEAEAIFGTLSAKTIRIGAQDCRIAAQAMAHGFTVVTRDVGDFTAIGATCADWSA